MYKRQVQDLRHPGSADANVASQLGSGFHNAGVNEGLVLGRDAYDHAIVRMILALAKTLNISAVAEGVDNPFQLERLKSMGCHLIQGYLYSSPLSAEEATSYLAQGLPVSTPQ